MVRSSLRSLPTSKAVAALGAAVLMVGGGVAAAQNVLPSQQDAGSATDSEAADDEAPEELGDEAPEVTSEEAPEDSAEEAPEEGGDEAPEEISDETPEEASDEVPQEAPEENVVEEAPGGDQAPEENVVEEAPDSDADDEPSETAKRVHEALSGDPDISPGHPDFGAKVSERARNGGHGTEVSRAARGVDTEPDGDHQDSASPRDERPNRGAAAEDRPGGGPPPWANNDGEKATPPGRR